MFAAKLLHEVKAASPWAAACASMFRFGRRDDGWIVLQFGDRLLPVRQASVRDARSRLRVGQHAVHIVAELRLVPFARHLPSGAEAGRSHAASETCFVAFKREPGEKSLAMLEVGILGADEPRAADVKKAPRPSDRRRYRR